MSIFAKIKTALAAPRDELGVIRNKIADLKAEKDAIARAPLDEASALAQLDRAGFGPLL
jgi:hypothetical protein